MYLLDMRGRGREEEGEKKKKRKKTAEGKCERTGEGETVKTERG